LIAGGSAARDPQNREKIPQFEFRNALPAAFGIENQVAGPKGSSMLPIEPKQAWSSAVIGVVTFTILFAALGAMVPLTTGTSATSGAALTSLGAAESSIPLATCGQVPVPLASAAS